MRASPILLVVALTLLLAPACEKKKPPPPPAPKAQAPAPAPAPPAPAPAPAAAPAMAVKPIPEGYHTLTPGLTVKGAADAIEWYKRAFGATEKSRMVLPGTQLVAHAELKIGDSILFVHDEMPHHKVAWPKGKEVPPAGLYMYVENVDGTYKRAVEAGARSVSAPKDMFWGDRYAHVVDPSGHHWGIATHKEDVPPDEMKKRGEAWAKEQQAKMKKKKKKKGKK
jgi:uncharacterized glyoxalase superfamily protein PhnB